MSGLALSTSSYSCWAIETPCAASGRTATTIDPTNRSLLNPTWRPPIRAARYSSGSPRRIRACTYVLLAPHRGGLRMRSLFDARAQILHRTSRRAAFAAARLHDAASTGAPGCEATIRGGCYQSIAKLDCAEYSETGSD